MYMHDEEKRTTDTTVLALYLKDINKIPLLSKEEEEVFARKAAQGDKEAMDRIINANLRFVVKVAKKYYNSRISLLDLISEGNIGLITAAKRYDVTKGCRFITYAVWWIRRAILKAVCEKTRMIRVPLNRLKMLIRIEKTKEELRREGIEPNIDVIAHRLTIEKDQIQDLINIAHEYVSLDSQRNRDNDISILDQFAEDTKSQHPDDLAIDKSLHDAINEVLNKLPGRESDIIQNYFGLNGKRPMTLMELSKTHKVSRERIRQIMKKALRKLQRTCGGYLRSYLA